MRFCLNGCALNQVNANATGQHHTGDQNNQPSLNIHRILLFSPCIINDHYNIKGILFLWV